MTHSRHRPESAAVDPIGGGHALPRGSEDRHPLGKAGKLTSIRTLGGHRRYRESEVRALLEGNTNATVRAELHPEAPYRWSESASVRRSSLV